MSLTCSQAEIQGFVYKGHITVQVLVPVLNAPEKYELPVAIAYTITTKSLSLCHYHPYTSTFVNFFIVYIAFSLSDLVMWLYNKDLHLAWYVLTTHHFLQVHISYWVMSAIHGEQLHV